MLTRVPDDVTPELPPPHAPQAPGPLSSGSVPGPGGPVGAAGVPHAAAPQAAVGVHDAAAAPGGVPALELRGLWRRFGDKVAVAGIDLVVPAGSFYGLVGPNGAGKTTTLSMATGLLVPDAGIVLVHGHDLWADPIAGKALIGILPDGVKLFDRLTGEQLITYAGLLRGLDRDTVAQRARDLLVAMDLAADARTLVVDYSAGMTKKIALACALVHAPRLLVLDEPFEAVDPVSAANIRDILAQYVASGGTVIVSSHVMDLVQRMCDHVAVVAGGHVLAAGTVDEVRAGESLEDRFVQLVGGRSTGEGLAWLRTSSD